MSLIIKTLSEINNHLRSQKTVKRDQVEPKLLSLLESVFLKVLVFCDQPQSRLAILEILKLYNNSRNFDNYVKPLLEVGWLQQTIPDKPRSKNQKYYTTDLGKKLLEVLSLEVNSGIKRIPVASSNIAAVGYDKEARILEIEFHHGAIYQYVDVPEKVYEELMGSPAIGAYFMNEIKRKFKYQKK
ncbi:KTSC domain-containing protein [Lunatimonas sp.]|uniref:KTSC domain-containing protein n=1 Tax=Lunatimonas sp. TaxID=2060141 RepID=UPI00344E3D18